jgi:hypothetical protein
LRDIKNSSKRQIKQKTNPSIDEGARHTQRWSFEIILRFISRRIAKDITLE